MPPPQRSTRSAPNVLLQSLPKKSRKPRLESAARPPGSTRTRLEPSGDGNGGEFEYELPTPTRHPAVAVAVAGSDTEAEVQLPRRKKHAPPQTKRDVVVSPSTKDKLRRLSAGGSVLGASMGETTPRRNSPLKKATPVTGKQTSKTADTQDVIIVATPRASRKRTKADSMDGSDSEEENIRPPSSSGSLDSIELSDHSKFFGLINRNSKTPDKKAVRAKKALKKNTSAQNAVGPASAMKDGAPRRKKARMRGTREDLADQSADMDKLMLAAIKNPSTPGEETIDHRDTLDSTEDRLSQEVFQKVTDTEDARDYVDHSERMKKKKEKQKPLDGKKKRKRMEKVKPAKPHPVTQDEDEGDNGREGNETEHTERSASVRLSKKSNHKNHEAANVPRDASKDYTPAPGSRNDSDDEDEEERSLAHCLDLVQKMADKYEFTNITFGTLREDFCALKVLQTPPHGELGYYKLIDTLAAPLLANKGARISTHEYEILGELTHIMHSLADFHGTAKKFEANLRRLVRMNLTQLRNIEKAQRAIKHVFDARRYVGDGTKWHVGDVWVGEDPGEEVVREANREAVRKRNEEIEKVLAQREKAVYGYRTPESVEELEGKRRRMVRSAGEEADEKRGPGRSGAGEEQGGDTHADEGELDDDEGIRLDSGEIDEESRSIHAAPEEFDEEGTRVDSEDKQDQGMHVGTEGESDSESAEEEEHSQSDRADSEEDESEHSQVTHTDEKPGYREEYYGYRPFEQQGSSEGRGGTPIVIGDDDVEVVHVEGFGERAVKERAKVEREARRGNGGSDGDVSVLEDSEWNEDEVDALLFGIEDYQGMEGFDIRGGGLLLSTRGLRQTNNVSREIRPDQKLALLQRPATQSQCRSHSGEGEGDQARLH